MIETEVTMKKGIPIAKGGGGKGGGGKSGGGKGGGKSGGNWPSTTSNPSGGDRGNNPPSKK